MLGGGGGVERGVEPPCVGWDWGLVVGEVVGVLDWHGFALAWLPFPLFVAPVLAVAAVIELAGFVAVAFGLVDVGGVPAEVAVSLGLAAPPAEPTELVLPLAGVECGAEPPGVTLGLVPVGLTVVVGEGLAEHVAPVPPAAPAELPVWLPAPPVVPIVVPPTADP